MKKLPSNRGLNGLALALVLLIGLGSGGSRAADYFDETSAQTLFAFDQVSIPHSRNLRLEMRSPEKFSGNPVVQRGPAGGVDALGVQFYGSILKINDKYRMWYVAYDDDAENKVASARWRPAYAESTDGIHWTKPNLGLVSHRGDRNNNLVRIDPALGFVNLKVLHDPEDPDPARRYKMTAHVYFRHNTRLGTLAPYLSADGLTWKMVKEAKPLKAELQEKDLLLPAIHFEPAGGLYQWRGLYYASGQNAMNATLPYQGRVTRLYRSADFVNWSHTSALSFVRDTQLNWLGPGRSLEGEQCHEGFSVWNRSNVLLGVYGRWHGAKEWKDITVDLGLLISNDGVSFREPKREWTFLKRGEDGQWDQGGLLQGQGFENIGERTFLYYGAWDPRVKAARRGGVGIATLPRDRLGDLVVELAGKGPGDYQTPTIVSEFVTAAVEVTPRSAPRFYLNAAGLGPKAALKIELLGEREIPLPQYSGDHAAIVTQSGFQTPILWGGKSDLADLPPKVHLKVTFQGEKNTDIRFSAIYVRNHP